MGTKVTLKAESGGFDDYPHVGGCLGVWWGRLWKANAILGGAQVPVCFMLCRPESVRCEFYILVQLR